MFVLKSLYKENLFPSFFNERDQKIAKLKYPSIFNQKIENYSPVFVSLLQNINALYFAINEVNENILFIDNKIKNSKNKLFTSSLGNFFFNLKQLNEFHLKKKSLLLRKESYYKIITKYYQNLSNFDFTFDSRCALLFNEIKKALSDVNLFVGDNKDVFLIDFFNQSLLHLKNNKHFKVDKK